MRKSLLNTVLLSLVLVPLGCGASDVPDPMPPPPPPPLAPPRADLVVAGDGSTDKQAQVVAASVDVERVEGRVAYYRFDEQDGPVLDSSGNDLHGVAKDVVRGEQGRFGGAAFFNGMAFVRVPASKQLDFTDAATVEVWMRIAGVDELFGRRINYVFDVRNAISRGTGGNDDVFILSTTTLSNTTNCGNLQAVFARAGGPTTNATTDCGVVPIKTWVHVAVVNDSKELRLYLNGDLIKVDKGGVMGPIASDLYIGQREQKIFGFQGALDELQWWRVVRTQRQICSDARGTWNGKSCVWEK